MKIFRRALRAAGWVIFLLASTLVVLVLLEKPRSVAEFHASLVQIETSDLLLAVLGCCIVATWITILGQQEN